MIWVAKTVIFGGLNDEMAEDLHKLVKEIGEVCSVTYPFPVTELHRYGLSRDGCKPNVSSVVYSSISSARKSVEMFHKKTIKGNVVWARQLAGEGSKTMKWKIIVRNLPFKMDENEIRDMFSSAGFIWDVLVPCNSYTGLSKGFAFIKFTSKQHTENAIRKFNGQKFSGRTIAVDWAVPKNVYTATDIEVSTEGTKESGDSDDDNRINYLEFEDSNVKEKSVDVAGIEPDDSHMAEDKPPPEIDIEEEEKISKKVLEMLFSATSEMAPPIVDDGDQKNGDIYSPIIKCYTESKPVNSGKISHETESTALKTQVSEDLQTTLFIRNIPFDANKEDIVERFSAFGEVRSFIPVLHQVTKRPKGTGFLKFHTCEAARSAVSHGNDPTGLGIFIKGRRVSVIMALDKKSVHIKEVEKLKNKESHDHRNLYLTKEGLIVGGTPAAEGVSTSDMTKREMLQKKKETKLKSPNFHISKTRLMIYNVPKSVTEKELKRVCIEAVRSRATRENPVILQVKIMRDSKDEKDGSTKIRARGVGFVQFTEHQHAIVALRVLNNNPETFGEEHRPIVDFALDNVQKLKQRRENTQGLQQGAENNGGLKEGGANQTRTNEEKKAERREKTKKGAGMGEGRGKEKERGTNPTRTNEAKKAERGVKPKKGESVEEGRGKEKESGANRTRTNEAKKAERGEKPEKVDGMEKVGERREEELGATRKRKGVGMREERREEMKDKRRKRKVDGEGDKLEALIQQYKMKFSSSPSNTDSSRITRRWFES